LGLLRRRGGWFAQGDRKLGLAGFRGVVEGVADAVPLACFEEQPALDSVGEAGEADFSVDIGADLEVELVGVHESVGDVDFDFREVDGLAVGIGNGEVGGAGAKAGIDDGNGFGIGGLGQRWGGQEEGEQDRFHRDDYKRLTTGSTEVHKGEFAGQNHPKTALPVGVTGTGY
jgi:hypothetical protein